MTHVHVMDVMRRTKTPTLTLAQLFLTVKSSSIDIIPVEFANSPSASHCEQQAEI